MTDWNSLLSIIETELDATGDYLIKSDVLQLKGLCDQMDEESFLPLDSKEISPMIAKRNIQFAELVDNVIEDGVSKNLFRKENLGPAAGKHSYGRYFMIEDYYFNFKFDNTLWSELRNNPFWLEVWGKGFSKAKGERPKVKKALSRLESDDYGVFYDNRNVARIPIDLELGEEKDVVVKSMTKQIYKIFVLLNENYEKM